jgi:hypothetical protein
MKIIQINHHELIIGTPCIAPVLDGERGMTQARLRERFPVSA